MVGMNKCGLLVRFDAKLSRAMVVVVVSGGERRAPGPSHRWGSLQTRPLVKHDAAGAALRNHRHSPLATASPCKNLIPASPPPGPGPGPGPGPTLPASKPRPTWLPPANSII